MSNPFPGMNPFLEDERLWPLFHHHLVTSLYQILLPGLVDRYRARVGQRHYVSEQVLFTSVSRQEHHEEFIEIRRRNDGRLVTSVDVVSPANKNTSAGRQAYLDRRQEARAMEASLVEIDLVLQGQPILETPHRGTPTWNYAVTVSRSTQPDHLDVATTTLRKRLPRFRLPLSPDDRDTVLDLQTAFNRCFDQGGFAELLDYRRDPPVPLDDDSRTWLDTVLRAEDLR